MLCQRDNSRQSGAVGDHSGSIFKPSAKGSKKPICLVSLLEGGAESDPAVQHTHCVEVGCSNTFSLQPAAHFSEMIRDREITSAGDFETPHLDILRLGLPGPMLTPNSRDIRYRFG
jgi:hypothetical protein